MCMRIDERMRGGLRPCTRDMDHRIGGGHVRTHGARYQWSEPRSCPPSPQEFTLSGARRRVRFQPGRFRDVLRAGVVGCRAGPVFGARKWPAAGAMGRLAYDRDRRAAISCWTSPARRGDRSPVNTIHAAAVASTWSAPAWGDRSESSATLAARRRASGVVDALLCGVAPPLVRRL